MSEGGRVPSLPQLQEDQVLTGEVMSAGLDDLKSGSNAPPPVAKPRAAAKCAALHASIAHATRVHERRAVANEHITAAPRNPRCRRTPP